MNATSSESRAARPDTRPAAIVQSLHHVSHRCYDPEETRRFYEDFLQLEFSAALPTVMVVDGKRVECLQMLFRMADGDFISFYHVPDDQKRDIYKPMGPMELHHGVKVSSKADWDQWVARVKDADIPMIGPLDHEFIESIYFFDPNGIMLEITYEYDTHDEFMDREAGHAHRLLKDWAAKTAEVKSQTKRVIHA